MLKQSRILLICMLVFGVLLAAACGKTPSGGQTKPASAGVDSTSAAAEPVSADQTTAVPEPTEPAARELNAEIAERYLGIIDGLYQKYGEGHISDGGVFLTGFAYISLMDLDGDGVEELICAYENPERGEFYPYVNEYAVYGSDSGEPLVPPSPVCNFGNGDAPGMGFLTKDGKVYIENYEGGLRVSYFHLENGIPVTDITFEEEENLDSGAASARLNGEPRDPETALAALEGFEAAGEKARIEFFDYEKNGTLAKILSDTNMTLNRLETLCGRAD